MNLPIYECTLELSWFIEPFERRTYVGPSDSKFIEPFEAGRVHRPSDVTFLEPFERRRMHGPSDVTFIEPFESRTCARTYRRDVFRAIRKQDMCTDLPT